MVLYAYSMVAINNAVMQTIQYCDNYLDLNCKWETEYFHITQSESLMLLLQLWIFWFILFLFLIFGKHERNPQSGIVGKQCFHQGIRANIRQQPN